MPPIDNEELDTSTDEELDVETPADPEPEADPPPPPSGEAKSAADIRRAAEARGRQKGLREAEKLARDAGFASVEEMAAAARSASKPGQQNQVDRRDFARAKREAADLLEERRKLNNQLAARDREIKDLKKQLADVEARYALRDTAREHGVVDTDYAVELFRRAAAKKSTEELKTFDQSAYFSTTLRQSHPHLYKVVEVPASSSPEQVAPPAPAPSKKDEPTVAPVDVKAMSRTEYEAYLRKKGLAVPGLS